MSRAHTGHLPEEVDGATERGLPPVTGAVTLIPGAGVVIRTNAYVGVLGENAMALLDEIREIERTVAVPDRSPRRGRHVVRALAELVENAEERIDVAFAATDNVGIAVYLHGEVYAEIDGGRREPFGEVPFDRGIPWPLEGLGLYLAAAIPDEPGEERFNLVAGEVPAAGLLLHTPVGVHSTDIHRADIHGSGLAAGVPSAGAPVGTGRHRSDERTADEDATGEDAPLDTAPLHTAPLETARLDGDAADGSTAGDKAAQDSAPDDSAEVPTQDHQPPADFAPTPASEADTDALTEPLSGRQSASPSPATPAPKPPPAGPRPASTLPPNPAFQVDSLQESSGESRPPLPKQERQRPAMEVGQVADSRIFVRGIRCSRGHLNHPRSWLCGVCGIRVDHAGGVLVEGERPPLGWLLLDNGATYLLDDNLVLGREPGTSGGARTGTPKPVRVLDESSQLSRRHIELRLVEWEVHLIDLGSANGTFVTDPNYGNRELRIPPHQPIPLPPGSHVRIGGRHFIFESPHARA